VVAVKKILVGGPVKGERCFLMTCVSRWSAKFAAWLAGTLAFLACVVGWSGSAAKAKARSVSASQASGASWMIRVKLDPGEQSVNIDGVQLTQPPGAHNHALTGISGRLPSLVKAVGMWSSCPLGGSEGVAEWMHGQTLVSLNTSFTTGKEACSRTGPAWISNVSTTSSEVRFDTDHGTLRVGESWASVPKALHGTLSFVFPHAPYAHEYAIQMTEDACHVGRTMPAKWGNSVILLEAIVANGRIHQLEMNLQSPETPECGG
jgi:hypothetical protein